jgi:formamidopyrimidine-DNA glycosylase
LRARLIDHRLHRCFVEGPFLLRSASPPLSATLDRTVLELGRLGKQIAIRLEGDLWLVLHLKIAGRLHWKTGAVKPGGRNLLAIFEFDNGSLTLTEAGTQRRAALHVAEGEAGLAALDPGGIEPLEPDSLFWLASLLETSASLRWKAVSNLVCSPQHLSSPLADDDAGSHGVAGRYARHNRPIRDAKVVDSIDFKAAINDGH